MDVKKAKRELIVVAVGLQKNITKVLQYITEYYKNISKIFQIVLTFVLKCNIYNTRKHRNKWRNYLGNR